MALLSVDQALDRILANVVPLAAETVPLEESLGRSLAAPLTAKLTAPPFAASAMDGYALRAADIVARPARLHVIAEVAAGHPVSVSLKPGQACRIFTGAPLPDGADAIVIQEITRPDGDHVIVLDGAIDPGHIRRRGFDFSRGDELIAAGIKLQPRHIALAAAMGYGAVPVCRRPRVAILSTGDELVPPGTMPGPGQIIASNHLGVAGLVRLAGGAPQFLGIARDTKASLDAHFDTAAQADILVTIGGASVGKHDLVAPVLEARGMALAFWKIAMRPGKPLMFGRLGDQRILGLPGNPVSSLICARVFLLPLIAAMLARRHQANPAGKAILAARLDANGPRQHYMRATLTPPDETDGLRRVTPVTSQDSSLLTPLAGADCLIVRPPGDPALPAGRPVTILSLDF